MIGKWIRILYVIVAWLFPVAILIQVFLVGLSLFTGQAYMSAWAGLHRFSPTLVGGYRPLELQALLEVRSFQVEYVQTVVAFGVPSEVVIAKRQPQARETTEEAASL